MTAIPMPAKHSFTSNPHGDFWQEKCALCGMNRKAEYHYRELTNENRDGGMTKEELIEILTENSKDRGDREIMHLNCDDALLKYIDDPVVTHAFNKGTKWYA